MLNSLRLGLVFVLVGMGAASVSAQGLTDRWMSEGERLFQSGKQFDEAAGLFQKVLKNNKATPDQTRIAHERLLSIYMQLSRADAIIQTAQRYDAWLLRVKDPSGRRSELNLELGAAYFMLGYNKRAQELLETALEVSTANSFDLIKRLTGYNVLAQISAKNKKFDESRQFWQQLQADAESQLTRPQVQLKPIEKIQLVWKLAEAYLALQKADKAVEQLQKLLPVHEGLRDLTNKRETLRRLSEANDVAKNYSGAIQNLKDALEIHEQIDRRDRLTRADLLLSISRLQAKSSSKADVARTEEEAIREYQFVLRNPGSAPKEVAGSIAAFWELENLFQSKKQFRQALQLSEEQASQWVEGTLIHPRLLMQQGGLQTILGSYSQARDRLRIAVKNLEVQQPVNLLELPRTYNNLALVELALEDAKRAEVLSRKSLELYEKNQLLDDLTRVESFNILGNSLAQQGEYRVAILEFRKGEQLCEKLGDMAKVQRSNLLLNIAILLKSQGEIPEAIQACQLAQQTYLQTPNHDELILAAYDASLTGMYASRGREGDLNRSAELGRSILKVCEKRNVEKGPLIIAAKHSIALESLAYAIREQVLKNTETAAKAFQKAESLWNEIRDLQEREKQSLLLPRTLNYLGLCQEFQKRLPEAQKWYERAALLQKDNPRSFPQTHFTTLWRIAVTLNQQTRHTEARQYLSEAIAIVEKSRLQTYGDKEQQAIFFDQFAGAFDQYIDWAIREKDLDDAFIAACRSKSRTLFDQLQSANVDPRAGLEKSHTELLQREDVLLRKLTALRARAQLTPAEAFDGEQARKLLREFDETQAEYARVHKEIINVSPVYNALVDDKITQASLKKIRQEILDDKTVLLLYHIGRENSYALLITNHEKTSSIHKLQVNADIAARIAQPEMVALVEGNFPLSRGMKAVKKVETDATAPERSQSAPRELASLNQDVAKHVLDHYWLNVTEPNFVTTRGMKVVVRPKEQPISTQRFDLVGDIFLPKDLRDRIKALEATRLIVIPDGPLHKLPLEAMVLEAGRDPKYVIDELPPIVYAPSAAILTILGPKGRPEIDPATPPTLLTVSNPAYRQGGVKAELLRNSSESERLFQLFGNVPLLDGTEQESVRIRSFFDEKNVKFLEGVEATEGKFRTALNKQRFLHIAAHGFADEGFSNRFGALLLTPPDKKSEPNPKDDGMLYLHEIYSLPLKDCELSVLSACLTNVAYQKQALEAGVTIASGFLCAGSRNVVASNWSVDDRSTVELMDFFFQEVNKSIQKGEKVDYAFALQTARKKVRALPGYSSPYFWAPFVIIGQVK